MRRCRNRSGKSEEGIIVVLVAVFMLFVVGAMAALSIDITTFYTARSEAQLVADGAALAAARALANSGLTSTTDPPFPTTAAKTLATNVAFQVAQAATNQVGGRTLAASEITVTFPNDGTATFRNNPHVQVTVQRADLPTFFARIWGKAAITVAASATAEAYNPQGLSTSISGGSSANPVAPICVKPWLLPNISPTSTATPKGPIMDATTGAVLDPNLLGAPLSATPFRAECTGGGCSTWPAPVVWHYYPIADDPVAFPAPTRGLPACAGAFNNYQRMIAGCVEMPIACGNTVPLDSGFHAGRNIQTVAAVNCLSHASASAADQIDPASSAPTAPSQFLAGEDNPLVDAGVLATGTDISVSDSLVTVPIYDSSIGAPVGTTATVIGFVQIFLNPDGNAAPLPGPPSGINTVVVNIVGCGSAASGTPVYGNGPSAVPVRLITPSPATP